MTVRNMPFLAPAAFTMVMGTGALAMATLEMSQIFPPLYWFAQFLNILNYALFFLLALWAALSWPKNVPTLLENFEQPDNCALYSALGIALLVLGTQALRFGFGEIIAVCVWGPGALITLVFNYGILLRFFLHPGIEMSHSTPVLFVPVASMVVLPVAGAPISVMLDSGVIRNIVILVSILALGGGLALYVGLFSMMLQRHLLIRPLPDQLAPTLWIHLAPIGWAAVALLALAQNVFPEAYLGAVEVIAILLFGAAIWWLIMAAIICIRALTSHNLTFSMAWWSFIFPIGSVTILSNHLAFAPANMLFPWLWALLAGLWTYCAVKTVVFLKRR